MQYQSVTQGAFFWALQGLCSLHRKPFSSELATQQLSAPYTVGSLVKAADAYGFNANLRKAKPAKLQSESFPLIVWLTPKSAKESASDAVEVEKVRSMARIVPSR